MKNLYVMFPEELGCIAPEIYGHFAEHIGGVIYDGIWVERILRWKMCTGCANTCWIS